MFTSTIFVLDTSEMICQHCTCSTSSVPIGQNLSSYWLVEQRSSSIPWCPQSLFTAPSTSCHVDTDLLLAQENVFISATRKWRVQKSKKAVYFRFLVSHFQFRWTMGVWPKPELTWSIHSIVLFDWVDSQSSVNDHRSIIWPITVVIILVIIVTGPAARSSFSSRFRGGWRLPKRDTHTGINHCL